MTELSQEAEAEALVALAECLESQTDALRATGDITEDGALLLQVQSSDIIRRLYRIMIQGEKS